MGYADDSDRPPTQMGFALGMLLLAILSFGSLFYVWDFENAFAGFAALFAMPFSLGALATQVGFFQFQKLGCLIAPIVLFAVIFPFVYFGMAEGLVCILMVLPFWLAAGLGGALAAYVMRQQQIEAGIEETSNRFRSTAWVILPVLLFMAEESAPPDWTDHRVVREVEIHAPVAAVWPLLVSIPDISAGEGRGNFTHDFAGLARPSDARLVQRGDSLVRLAQWGDDIRFEEHITEIQREKRIAWRFVFPDDSIQQYTDRHIAPQGGMLRIADGLYELVEQDGGRSLLRLTTSYQMRSRLEWYLELWGERMLGDIQSNVLEIVKDRAEGRVR